MTGPGLNLILLEKSQTCGNQYAACQTNVGAKITVSGGNVSTLPQTVKGIQLKQPSTFLIQCHSPGFQMTTTLPTTYPTYYSTTFILT